MAFSRCSQSHLFFVVYIYNPLNTIFTHLNVNQTKFTEAGSFYHLLLKLPLLHNTRLHFIQKDPRGGSVSEFFPLRTGG